MPLSVVQFINIDMKTSTAGERQFLMEKSASPIYKFALVLIPIILYWNAVGLSSYAVNEWMQHTVQIKFFPDETLNKSSPCESVNKSSQEYILYRKVESESAEWMLYQSLAGSIPSLFASLLLPSYSDSLGRRFLFIISATGLLLKCLLTSFAIHLKLSLAYVIVGSLIEGMCGSFFVFTSAIASYVADVTIDGKTRTVAMTAADGVGKLCMTTSGLAAGYFISNEGYFIPVITSCCMLCIALVFCTCIVPESYPKAMRSNTLSVFGNLRRSVEFYTSDSFKGKRSVYSMLILSYFLSEVTSAHRSSLELLYQLGKPFCWSAEKVGIFGATRHGVQSFTAIVLVKPLKSCFSDLKLAVFSTVFKIGSYVLEGLARTDLSLYAVTILATFSNIAVQMIKCIMSLMTPPDKQGSLFASIFAVYGLCGIVAPYLMNTVYAETVDMMSGIVFLLLAAIAGLALLVLLLYGFIHGRVQPSSTTTKILTIS